MLHFAISCRLLLLVVFALAHPACGHAQNFLAGRNPANIADIELMRFYGSIVRASFRTGNRDGLRRPDFIAVEAEVQKRGLVTVSNYEEIEKGIVHLDMPLPQIHAAIDNLERTDVVTFEQFTISVYQGNVPDWGSWRPAKPNREFVLVCNGKLIGYRVAGETTFETFSGVPVVKSKAQTNFTRDHFDPKSVEGQKWVRSGRGRSGKQPISLAKGGHLWFLFELAENRSTSRLVRSGGGWVEEFKEESIPQRVEKLAMNKYPTLKGYLEAACR